MAVEPVAEPVHVPQRYPTALVFVDESSTKVSAGRFFVVGAVKTRRPGRLIREVQDIRDRRGYVEEFKFSKITRARLPVFSELVDALERSDAHIAAFIVDRTRVADPFGCGEPQWKAHARITAQLLAGIINRRELASVLIDQISTPKNLAFDDTVREMVSRLWHPEPVRYAHGPCQHRHHASRACPEAPAQRDRNFTSCRLSYHRNCG